MKRLILVFVMAFICSFYLKGQSVSKKINTGYEKDTAVVTMPGVHQLKEVIVRSFLPSVKIKRDTIQYNTSLSTVLSSDVTIDLLKRLPGITVDQQGNITAFGRPVTKIRVEGKDFFIGNIAAVIKTFPADVIKNIEVINDYGDLANITGNKSGASSQIININLKEDKKVGVFGSLQGAVGTKDRYIVSGSANTFNKKQQLSVITSINNTNTGSLESGPITGGGMGSMASGGNGISITRMAGLNYRNSINKNLIVYGNYDFAQNQSVIKSSTFNQNFYPGYILTSNQNGLNTGNNKRQQLNFNIEYTKGSDYLKFSPSVSLSNNSMISNSVSIINNLGSTSTLHNALNLSSDQFHFLGAVLYNHKFKKAGRNLSFNANTDYLKNDQVRNIDNQTDSLSTTLNNPANQHLITGQTDNTKTGLGSFQYSEPLSTSTSLVLNYTYSQSQLRNIINTSIIDRATLVSNKSDSLSDIYNYKNITNTGSFKFRTVGNKVTFSYGGDMIRTQLNGQSLKVGSSTHYQTLNINPAANLAYALNRNSTLSIDYRANSVAPTFMELEPVRDVSNPQNELLGNPDLKSEFSHTLKLQYNTLNPETHTSFFSNIDFNLVQNKIVLNRISTGNSITQQSTFLNTNGYKGVRAFYSLTKPLKSNNYVLTLSGSGDLSNNLSFVNGEKNAGQSIILSQSAIFLLNFPGVIENEVVANYSLNYSSYTQPVSTSSSQTINFGVMGKRYIKKLWVFNYDVVKTLNTGYKSAGANKPLILNFGFERKLFKNEMASLKLTAFDILNQSIGLQRTVIANQIIDTRTNALGRYFLLSFNIRLQKFAGIN